MIKLSAGAAHKAVRRTAELVLNAAKENCPVRTGRLKNSIAVKVQNNTAVVFTDVEYAAAVELGTARQRPQSFLSRGMAEASKEAGKIFMEELL